MNRRMLLLSLSIPVLLWLTACSERSTRENETAGSEYPSEVLAAHMRDHLHKATQMQAAVINADLDALQEPAEWMANHANSEAMPEDWYPLAERMHAAARQVAEAADLEGAARATAIMATECGNCHQVLGAQVSLSMEEAPSPGNDTANHMERHAWAAGRLWEGMIIPSGVVWDRGAEVLVAAPLAPPEILVDIEVLADVAELEVSVHELGSAAVGLSDQNARAQVYGELLAMCAACHESIGKEKR